MIGLRGLCTTFGPGIQEMLAERGQAMYAVIRKYNLLPGTVEEFIQQVQTGLVPIFHQIPGFKAYYLVDIGENEVAVISLFDTLADAKASANETMTGINEHTDLYFQGFSKLMAGLVRVHIDSSHLPLTSKEELLQGIF